MKQLNLNLNKTLDDGMTMSYELITPEIAKKLLQNVGRNRSIAQYTVDMYANDMLTGRWDERVGSAISIDKNGVLRDGQHRMKAIIKSGRSIWMWVCRGVETYGMYDHNRRRTASDQIKYGADEGFEKVYSSPRYIAVARLIMANAGRKNISPKAVMEFTHDHKNDLDGFFLKIPQSSVAKVSTAAIHTALFSAYMGGVSMNDILAFYSVLCDGMSTKPEEYPIIAYRNYLKDHETRKATLDELARCQYALKKYLTGSCVKKSASPGVLIWPLPYKETQYA